MVPLWRKINPPSPDDGCLLASSRWLFHAFFACSWPWWVCVFTPFKERVELESPMEQKPVIEYDENIPMVNGRQNVGVVFSGGIDSTAVLISCHLVSQFTRRFIGQLACTKLRTPFSQSKKWRRSHRFKLRWTTQGIWKVKGILWKCGIHHHRNPVFRILPPPTLADGNVLERMYLFGLQGHGTKYRDQDLSNTMDAFGGGKSRLLRSMCRYDWSLNHENCRQSWNEIFHGQMRGEGGNPCNNCLKCFRKRGLQGNPLPTNKEVEKKLDKEYIPMLPSLLWARDHKGLRHPKFNDIEMDATWVDKWYPKSLEYIPEYLHKFFLNQLKQFEIDAMEDTDGLLSFSSKID